jgi:hypothetical protein
VGKGRVGTSMSLVKGSAPRCKHRWTPWARAGMFDSTQRRDCLKCRRIQTRKPKKKTPLAR